MGLDAIIYFEKTGAIDELHIPNAEIIARRTQPYEDPSQVDAAATHRVEVGTRFYGRESHSGPGHWLCSILMLLHAHPGVGKVYYGHDCEDYAPEVSQDDVLKLASYYMQNGQDYWFHKGISR